MLQVFKGPGLMRSVRAGEVRFTLLLFMTVQLRFKDLLLTTLKSSDCFFVFRDSTFKVIFLSYLLIFTELSTSPPSGSHTALPCCIVFNQVIGA